MAEAGPRNQTLSFLLNRFREVGIEPRNRHGQNFLIDLNLVRLLVDAAQISREDLVLEIGTGTGSLTALLADRAAAVISVEIDPQLYQLASEELFGANNVTLLQLDALHNKNRLDARVLAAIGERLASRPELRLKLAANLPYNIATPVLTNLLASDHPPASMTVTIQKEVADRIVASPGTKDYGALSIWIQSQCRSEIVRVLPPSVFWPRPKVTSAIIHIELEPARRAAIADLSFFHQFTRNLFLHRRKFLRSALLGSYKDSLGKEGTDKVLADLGISGQRRAEELDVPTVLALADTVRERLPATAPPGTV